MVLDGKQSNPWHAAGSSLLRCPVKNCGHAAPIITKAHCRIAHDMEREEVEKRYGLPTRVIVRHPFKDDNTAAFTK